MAEQGFGGKSLVRTMKVPAGLLSLAHDSSVGSDPHDFFHVSFGAATREQRTPGVGVRLRIARLPAAGRRARELEGELTCRSRRDRQQTLLPPDKSEG